MSNLIILYCYYTLMETNLNEKPFAIRVEDRWCQVDIFVTWESINDYISGEKPFNLPMSDAKLEKMMNTQVNRLAKCKTLEEFESAYDKYGMYPIDFRYI